jgi:hypothetical protein
LTFLPDAIPRPIIVTRIEGGLGNQLFQYAIGRRLAHMAQGHLILMLEDNFESRDGRNIGLPFFNITGDFIYQATLQDSLKKMFPQHVPLSSLLLAQERHWTMYRGQAGSPELANRRDLSFLPAILAWRNNLVLHGFWQDERYFADIPTIIKNEFTLRIPFDQRNRETLARIKSGASAFIHVRRGDYLKPKWQAMFGGTGAAAYYHQAFKLLQERHGENLTPFVFSDDPQWVRENQIGGPDAEIIDWNGATPAHDIMLMRACDHAIISNSTFSWWGAWLGEVPGNTIIAPQPWFETLPEYTEIVPERWLRL